MNPLKHLNNNTLILNNKTSMSTKPNNQLVLYKTYKKRLNYYRRFINKYRLDYYIYRIEVKGYFYYGSSYRLDRKTYHYNECYYPSHTNYNYPKSKKIRELIPNSINFNNLVNFTKLHIGLSKTKKEELELYYIQKYKDSKYNLNGDKYIFQNGDTIEGYMKNYRNNNRNKLNNDGRRKVICKDCGVIHSYSNGTNHRRHNKTHIEWLKNKKINNIINIEC